MLISNLPLQDSDVDIDVLEQIALENTKMLKDDTTITKYSTLSTTLPNKLEQMNFREWNDVDELLQVERKVNNKEKLYQTMPAAITVKTDEIPSHLPNTTDLKGSVLIIIKLLHCTKIILNRFLPISKILKYMDFIDTCKESEQIKSDSEGTTAGFYASESIDSDTYSCNFERSVEGNSLTRSISGRNSCGRIKKKFFRVFINSLKFIFDFIM